MTQEQYELFLKHADDFWAKVDGPDDDSCWPWQGGTFKGYGLFSIWAKGKTKNYLPHRIALALHLGRPLRGSALHRCDNPICCNPKCLFEGTQAQNMADMTSKGRAAKGERHGFAKLTERKVRTMRAFHANGTYSQKELAQIYQVSRGAVSNVLRRKLWAHID
jgi:hypothetical protein